jgi:hypothetical protein
MPLLIFTRDLSLFRHMSAPGSARVDTKTRSRWQHERQHREVLAVVVG